uniref:Particle protein n=3 Tax=unclassified bacterial viruses TaxID=12333 RepID=A0AAU6VZG2_9VIRU
MALDLIRVEVKNPVGIISDPSATDVPLQAWNDASNVRFKDGRVTKAQGYEAVFPVPPERPLFLMPYLSGNVPFWFSAGAGYIHRTEGSSWVNVTRSSGPYAAGVENQWSGGFLNQVAVLNNPANPPQSLRPNGTLFEDLPNWPADTRAKVIRPFKNYLVAMNITRNSVEQNTTVKWSSPADPGEVPFTWDVNDATNDAGESFLADTAGAIVDGKKLKDSFIIYKEDSVYAMRYIGGVFVFQFQQLFDDVGMLSRNCAAEFDGKHFVVGQGDVYVHNGVQKQSVIDGKMKNFLYSAIKATGINNVFVVPDYNNTEMWVCFQGSSAQSSNGTADTALIWNWREDTWTMRQIPNAICGTFGIMDPQVSDAWDADGQIWDQDQSAWGSANYNPSKTRVVLGSYENNRVYSIGEVTEFGGAPFLSRLEKRSINFDDDQRLKFVSSVTPHFSGSGKGKVYVGASMLHDAPTEWFGPYPYEVGKDYKIDCRVTGRYIGVRFEIESVGAWTMNGYTIEMTKPTGKR